MKFLLSILILFSFLTFTGCDDKKDFNSLDIEKLDRMDFDDYMSKAKSNANNENFSSAYDYLNKAKKLGISKSEISDMQNYIEKKETQYNVKIERERESRSYSSASSSTSNNSSITVTPNCINAICSVDNFSLSGDSGNISMGYNVAFIYNAGNGGTYNYSITISPSKKICSGSFQTNGRNKNITINIHEHNCSGYTNEY